jgi:hypothetical protein
LIANARFLSVFQKTIYKVKMIDLKKIRLYEVSSKVATFVEKCFNSKIPKWQKVFHQEKKFEKVQICQNAPTSLNELTIPSDSKFA